MRITILIAAAALAATIGTASAADEFATLKGVKATPMASSELDAVKGLHRHFVDAGGGGTHVTGPAVDLAPDGHLTARSYRGLCVASGISVPSSGTHC